MFCSPSVIDLCASPGSRAAVKGSSTEARRDGVQPERLYLCALPGCCAQPYNSAPPFSASYPFSFGGLEELWTFRTDLARHNGEIHTSCVLSWEFYFCTLLLLVPSFSNKSTSGPQVDRCSLYMRGKKTSRDCRSQLKVEYRYFPNISSRNFPLWLLLLSLSLRSAWPFTFKWSYCSEHCLFFH